MRDDGKTLTSAEAKGLRTAKELEGHLIWLNSFTPAALGVLATASGIYTYLGVSSLLEDTGSIKFFAAVAYSLAVSIGIFVFWSYILRLLPSMRSSAGYIGLTIAMFMGSAAIIAMSSWLNAAALAGAAAVERHLERTVLDYQSALEQAHEIALSGQALGREVRRARESFEALAEQERAGDLSGTPGQGAVFRVLVQKTDELRSLEEQIESQEALIEQAYANGNDILGEMRALTVAPGRVDQRSLAFSEESVRLAGTIANLNQYSVAPLVARAAEDLPASVVLPELDGRSAEVREAQSSTISSVMTALDQRGQSLLNAANEVLEMEPPVETAYNPVSSADAVIRYAGNFVPSWAGAIAIDLLPAVLVFVLAVTQATIRSGREGLSIEDTMTLTDLRAAINAMRDMDASMADADSSLKRRLLDSGTGRHEEDAPDGDGEPR